ncbi:CUB and zona pellucida-like domains 1 L homeolog precursor [Xenopus laevis]|uniref:CUB and zona pellucida-like domains 1 L homeolog precursor n=1 Tax=Xenopus laevis TaxID=8355 RepID=A8WH54_XENLA|nr:CUB and zona pellucida-like domains 1 L homeolog precursor [Xenopus laevis]AAI54979.1 LOC100127260 protein [Xenopus laevis]
MPSLEWLTIFFVLLAPSLAQEKASPISEQCGDVLTEPYQPLQIKQSADKDCTWDIKRSANETTRLVFSVLNLNPNADCSQENVTVSDENLQVLGVLCPNSPQISVFEAVGGLSVRVFTDSNTSDRILYLFYNSFATGSEPVSCGGNTRGISGTISSPSYPNRHPDFAFCVWHLDAPKNTKIQLSFTEIFLEIDPLCRFDFIAVYDGPSTSSPLLDLLCGRTTAQLETSSNSVTLMLSADYANSYFGFSAAYKALPKSNTTSLSCSGDEMTVIINPSYLESLGYTADELTLTDTACGPLSSNPVAFIVPYQTCGTVRKLEDHTISYTNTISASLARGLITRRKQVQIIVTCELDGNTVVEIMYTTEDDIIQEQRDTSRYDVGLSFFTSETFVTPVLESPYFVDLNQTLFLQATLHLPDPQLTVFTDSCFASSEPKFQAATYDLVRQGCAKDDTYHNFPSGSGFARFSFGAFKFLHLHNSVYLKCRVVICDTNDTASRCNQGCITRHRRDLGSSKWKANAVVGPIRLGHHTHNDISESIGEENGSKAEHGSFYLFGILVLVANVLIVSLVVLRSSRKQRAAYRYHPVPTQ